MDHVNSVHFPVYSQADLKEKMKPIVVKTSRVYLYLSTYENGASFFNLVSLFCRGRQIDQNNNCDLKRGV